MIPERGLGDDAVREIPRIKEPVIEDQSSGPAAVCERCGAAHWPLLAVLTVQRVCESCFLSVHSLPVPEEEPVASKSDRSTRFAVAAFLWLIAALGVACVLTDTVGFGQFVALSVLSLVALVGVVVLTGGGHDPTAKAGGLQSQARLDAGITPRAAA